MTASNFTRYLKASTAPAILGLALMSAPAFAQDENAAEPVGDQPGGIAPAEQVQTAAVSVDEDLIVVTGSRLSNPNLELSSPVAAITEDEIELRQTNTVEEFIRQIPGVVPSVGSNVNNGNGGATFLNLRGLGTVRNIVLLNGTRLSPNGLAGVTNIDVIPVAILERTDVLTGGAGATYGADAIAGVTNFVTKRDFEGVELALLESITEEGDGNTFRGDVTLGANFDDGRGNAVLSIGYTNRDQVTQGQREFSAENISSTSGLAAGSGTSVPSIFLGLNDFDGDGDLDAGQIQPDGSFGPDLSLFNFNPFNLLQTPLEQFRIYGSAFYEVNENLEFFTEGLFQNSTTATQIAPSGTFFNPVEFPASNPFLSDAQLFQLCDFGGISDADCAAGNAATDPTDEDFFTFTFPIGRRFVEFGTRDNSLETTLFQLKGGLRGNVVGNIDYEIYGAYGESENVSIQSGNGTLTLLQQALLATNPTTCLDPSGGCTPIDLFGPLGSLTPENQAFLDVGNTTTEGTSLATVSGFVGGDFGLTSPFAEDPISFVVGGEYRENTAFTFSDALSQIPGEVLGNGAADIPIDVSYDVYEAFGELAIPALSDRPFAEELTFLLKGRVSDYSTVGTEYTYTAGGTWTPYPGFQVRGNFARSVRAPNLFELFTPPNVGLDNSTIDPCAGGLALTDPNLTAVCLAQTPGAAGLGPDAQAALLGGIIVNPASQVNVAFGGNPDLDAEDADTFTVGLIAQPEFVPGLSVTVDYYNIEVTNAITTPTVDDVFGACFGPDFGSPSAVSGFLTPGSAADPACTSIGRDPATGNLFGTPAATGLPQFFSNLGTIETDGIDLVINYDRDFGLFGANFSFFGNWTNNSEFQATPTSINRECVGFYSVNCTSIQPEFSFNQRTTFSYDVFDLSVNWRWIDSVVVEPLANVADGGGTVFLEEFSSIGDEHVFDLTLRAAPSENLTLIFAVLNITDNEPPFVGSTIGSTAFNTGNTYPSTYNSQTLGRTYSAQAKIRF